MYIHCSIWKDIQNLYNIGDVYSRCMRARLGDSPLVRSHLAPTFSSPLHLNDTTLDLPFLLRKPLKGDF